MPKKIAPNSKAVAANERKAAHQAEVEAKKRAEAESKQAAEWSVGARGRSKKEIEEEKRAAQKAKKAEADALLRAEEEGLKANKKTPRSDSSNSLNGQPKKVPAVFLRGAEKAAAKKAVKVDAKSKEIEKFGGLSGVKSSGSKVEEELLAASNIDDALDLLNVTGGGTPGDSSSRNTVNSIAAGLERHPERRAKAAYKIYEENMLPQLKKENPSLRLTQLKEMLWKMWQKAPENPFNQQHISHTASKEEERAIVEKIRLETESRLRVSK